MFYKGCATFPPNEPPQISASFHALDNFTGKDSPQVKIKRKEPALLPGPSAAGWWWLGGSSHHGRKWLITMVSCKSQDLGLGDPFQVVFFWLINGGDPNHLLNGMILLSGGVALGLQILGPESNRQSCAGTKQSSTSVFGCHQRICNPGRKQALVAD